MFNFLTDSISAGFAGGLDQDQNSLPRWHWWLNSYFILVSSD